MARFFHRQIAVEATQLKDRMTIESKYGTQVGEPGDWLVIELTGDISFVTDKTFKAGFDPINGYYPQGGQSSSSMTCPIRTIAFKNT
jgi:hypothetical protein